MLDKKFKVTLSSAAVRGNLMKKSPAMRVGIVFVLGLVFLLHAQEAAPLSLTPADVATFSSLSEAQLAALVSALDETPTFAVEPGTNGTFWSLQNPGSAPLPFDSSDSGVWLMSDGSYLLDDLNFNYQAAAQTAQNGSVRMTSSLSEDGGSLASLLASFDTNGLWLEITNVDWTNQLATLLLHNTDETKLYQLLSKTNLLQPDGWTLGEIKTGDAGTNETVFAPVNLAGNSMMFFNAHQADGSVSIQQGSDEAVEPEGTDPGQVGTFYLTVSGDMTNDLTVHYTIGGTASNGVDYTNLSGVAVVPVSLGYAEIDVQPLADNLVEGTETVTLTLTPTDDYLIDPAYASATNYILDSSKIVGIAWAANAVEPDGPPGAAAVSGSFYVYRYDTRGVPDTGLTVYYTISGTASNGVDYAILSGTIDFPAGDYDTNLDITPLADNLPEGVETVTLTLVPTNTYLLEAGLGAATNLISDSTTTVGIYSVTNALEPGDTTNFPGLTGCFTLTRSDAREIYTNLTVDYLISGTASNGVDYTSLSGMVTFAPGAMRTNIYVQPLADDLLEGDETVILTLDAATDDYFIDVSSASATITLADGEMPFETVANVSEPVGMDYSAPANSIIVSSESTEGFVRIYTNLIMSNSIIVTNIVVTNWSGITGLQDEVKLATVKTTANGFTNGEMFFGNNGVTNKIGRLSADGTVSNLTFATLTNDTYIRGGLYIDQSGSFDGDLIAVTGNLPSGVNAGGGVWRIKSSGVATRLVNITNTHLEGVITLTNDPAKWGPWAGKIITGAESKTPPEIYAISPDGTVQTFQLGIGSEDFDLIPANQDLYCSDEGGANNKILKVSREYFAPYVGDLLITQSGDGNINVTPTLFIVHWDSTATNFVIRGIPNPGETFEHVTFAPIDLPAP
jgi:hypothetical protein